MREFPISYSECGAIHGRTVEADLKSILFVSAEPGEGTSTVAYAVAQRAAATGKRVLYIDFNTRSSFPRDVLRLPAGSWNLGEPVPDSAFSVISRQGLTFLPAPVERSFGIEARRTETVTSAIREFLKSFDLVIGDSPCLTKPNGHNVAPAALAASFDGTVLTVASAATSKESIQQALGVLTSAGAALVGCVLVDRSYPALSKELDRQFGKLGRVGRLIGRLLRPMVRRVCAIEGQF